MNIANTITEIKVIHQETEIQEPVPVLRAQDISSHCVSSRVWYTTELPGFMTSYEIKQQASRKAMDLKKALQS
jgi:hypothetical protein